jgi:hypothetical protein
MYTEIVDIHDTGRLRKVVDPESIHFTDAQLVNILIASSGMIDRAVVKCFLGVIQKAKEEGNVDVVEKARIALGRFEAGLIDV